MDKKQPCSQKDYDSSCTDATSKVHVGQKKRYFSASAFRRSESGAKTAHGKNGAIDELGFCVSLPTGNFRTPSNKRIIVVSFWRMNYLNMTIFLLSRAPSKAESGDMTSIRHHRTMQSVHHFTWLDLSPNQEIVVKVVYLPKILSDRCH